MDMNPRSQLILQEIRKCRDTSLLDAALFHELCRAIFFYMAAHADNKIVAKLVMEEIWS
jgi:hypothetical protein